MKLSDATVKALKPKDAKYYIHGDMSSGRHGFSICVYPTGTKSWFFIYRWDDKRCFMPLGKYPTMTLADAAKEFEEQWAIFASGRNPATVKEEEQAALEAAPTVKALVADYIARHAAVNKKSWQEDQRILEKEILGIKGGAGRQAGAVNWSKRKAADIKKKDIVTLLDKIVARDSPGTANAMFKVLRKMFNWACEKDILESSPCDHVKMPVKPVARDRVLDAAEIKTVWGALDDKNLSMTPEVRMMLKLVLVTAQRPGEISGIHTSEIDGEWWNIPAERSKNGKAHRVFLTALAREIIAEGIERVRLIREIPPEKEYSGFVFPCRHHAKDKPMERLALSRALLRNASPDGTTTLDIATWTPHDLRRTAATMMSELKFTDEIIDAVLNHSKKGIAAPVFLDTEMM